MFGLTQWNYFRKTHSLARFAFRSMGSLIVKDLSKSFGGDLFRSVTFQIQPGERAFLFGPNGSGKSTLLKIINKEIDFDSGEIRLTQQGKMGYMPQDIDEYLKSYQNIETVGEYLTFDNEKLFNLMNKFIEAPSLENKKKYFESGGFEIAKILAEIKLTLDREFNSLSGGEKRKIVLARLILDKPDLLMLDEPTNHMDEEGKLKIINLLKQFKKSLFIVSHDRLLTETIGDKMLEINPQTKNIDIFHCSYKQYQKIKEQNFSMQMKNHQQELTNLRRVRQALDQLEGRQNKKSSAQRNSSYGAKKSIRRLTAEFHELQDNMHDTPKMLSTVNFCFDSNNVKPAVLMLRIASGQVNVSHLKINVKEEISLYPGQRIYLAGENGAGKTTLLHNLFHLKVMRDKLITMNQYVKISYLTQDQCDFDRDKTALDFFQARYPDMHRQQLIKELVSITDIMFEQLNAFMSHLSNGQIRRLQIADVMLSRANLLLLDEPNNHLDVKSLELLENALRTFPGVVIFTSHDSHFVGKVATDKWVLTRENREVNIQIKQEHQLRFGNS